MKYKVKKIALCALMSVIMLPITVFSQIIENSDDRGVTMRAKVFLYSDSQGFELTKGQFTDSIATQKYILGTKFQNDTMRLFLKNKRPDITGKQLPEVEWNTLNGDILKYDQSDKITLLSFWSVICKPCIEEFDELNRWVAAYPDVQIIAVTKDSTLAVLALMKMHNITWENITIVPEYKGDFDNFFRIYSWPTNIVMDSQRIVRKVFIGKNEELTNYVCSLL